MTIIDHWLKEARREVIYGGAAMPIRRALVIHFTAGATAISSINYWRQLGSGICAHIVIDRDGTIYQCRPFNRQCGHAGVSRWKDPKTGRRYGSANGYAIGIELANAGDSESLAKRWSKLVPPTERLRHRNGGALSAWERFPSAQVAACTVLSKLLVARYNLDDVTSHDAIAPERKNDVGPAFPMKELRKACGFGFTEPVVHMA